MTDAIAKQFAATCGPDVRYARHKIAHGRLEVVFWIGSRRFDVVVSVKNGTLGEHRRAARAAASQAASHAYIATGKLDLELSAITEAIGRRRR